MFNLIFVTLFCVITCVLPSNIEYKFQLGVGNRYIGNLEDEATSDGQNKTLSDKLIVKDVLQAPSSGYSYNKEISFIYAVPEPITYIEVVSEENAKAEISFSYADNLVKGLITALDSKYHPTSLTAAELKFGIKELKPFMIEIRIYGYNDTVVNLQSENVLNRDQFFEGILQPQQSEAEYVNESAEPFVETFDETQTETEELQGNETEYASLISMDDNDDEDFEYTDSIIELGQRQDGDYMLYEIFQTSSTTSKEQASHSIAFYYIDSNFITYVQFVIYDQFIDKSLPDKSAPTAEYSQISQNTLKAVITDNHTTSLFVQMFVYGYKPEDRPHIYMPYLIALQRPTHDEIVITTTMSSVQQLKMWLRGEKQTTTTTTPTQPLPMHMNDVEDNNVSDNPKAVADVVVGGKELPFCKPNAAFSLTSNLLIMAPYYCAIGISCFWILLADFSLFSF